MFGLNTTSQASSLALSLLVTLAFAGCSNDVSPGQLKNPTFIDGLYSNRPLVENPVVSILKLQAPALMETSKRENGKLVVDEDLAAAIQEEQEATIQALKNISPNIRVLIRYKFVLNGLAVWVPADLVEKVKGLPNVTMSEKASRFARPKLAAAEKKSGLIGENTSVKFIGSEAAYAQNIRGQGMKVGVIDTGIDYTHKMFLGEGTGEAYKNINPDIPNAAFPNKKVVGGIDLVGTKFDASSADSSRHIPIPDANPLDEAEHGTHVAGTVAGIGDGQNTYSGVAPEADLYAIKVFGADGSTSDEVVIAALEYAASPSGELSAQDQLDVVNLSLGSGYGNPHIMYNHAIKNLVRGGTVVVASGGNSGDEPYIVGAPGTSDNAISVASSIDNMNHNIQFASVEFKAGEAVLKVTEAIEGAITAPLKDIAQLSGEVIYVGIADKDFESPLKEQIEGKVAFIDRGGVSFADKIRRAQEAKAIAVVVANNNDEDPFVMGGDGAFTIPGVMVSKSAGVIVKAALTSGQIVVVDLKTAAVTEKPWLVDTISPFSSRGPRSDDGLIKPEITSPGTNIISAAVGTGDEGAKMSGTSMAGPHIAGVMALLKQKHKDLNTLELKSILLGQGKVIHDANKADYSVARQGSGRVQVAKSIDAKALALPSTLSLGITDIEKQKTLFKEVTLKNISTEAMTLTGVFKGSAALTVNLPAVSLAPGESKTIAVNVTALAAQMKSANEELEGYLTFSNSGEEVLHMPVLLVARQIAQVSVKSLVVKSTSAADAPGSLTEVVLENAGVNKGQAFLFNLIGQDARKLENKPDAAHNKNCDLQSAGYRLLEKDGALVLQVAVKLYEGMTTWNTCEVNVQIDSDQDNVVDQEIAGMPRSSLPGVTGNGFVSLLLDGTKARTLRKAFESEFSRNPEKAAEDYSSAVQGLSEMKVFNGSTLAIIEANVSDLAVSPTGELNIKISTTHQDSGIVEYDDYLGDHSQKWQKISVSPMGQSFAQLPEVVELAGKETKTLSLQKGYANQDLVLFAPQNRSVRDSILLDTQSQVVPVTFEDAE